MKRFLPILFVIVIISIIVLSSKSNLAPTQTSQPPTATNLTASKIPPVTVIAQNLKIPWSLVFLPNGQELFTTRGGEVRNFKGLVATVLDVKTVGEGGLLGITVHPNFNSNHFIYLYYTYSENGGNVLNKVVRYKFENNQLTDPKIILDKIPGSSNHDGGRIKFGPDGNLYIGTGDAEDPSQAQNTNTLGGKILRLKDDGSIPPDNPFGNAVYSYGHRNVQGIAWDEKGQLWATEHGRSGVQTGFDEVNKILKGGNFGWPTIQGDETKEGMITPVINSGAATTWAPSGMAYFKGSLFFAGLRGSTLYEAKIVGDKLNLSEHFKNEFGRLRDVIVGPDNMFYVLTSNTDGRGTPKSGDDKILKIDPLQLK